MDIREIYKDDLTPWKGNPHLRKFIITMDGDNLRAGESKNDKIECLGQCYIATHFDYSKTGNKILKKVCCSSYTTYTGLNFQGIFC